MGKSRKWAAPQAVKAAKPEAKILFQKYFHSVGPRTYATQVKELANGNHLLVITEGKRDPESGEVRKTRLLVFGEDFSAFFKLLQETAGFIRANPLSEEIREKRRTILGKEEQGSPRIQAGPRPNDIRRRYYTTRLRFVEVRWKSDEHR